MPAWAWLAVLVLVSFLFRAWVARGMAAPFIMVDELIYSELAKSFARLRPLSRPRRPHDRLRAALPGRDRPAYALFDSIPQAYGAVKTINALVMSLAGIPAFLLARRVLPASWALLAAVLALALPSLLYTATVMTENLFYPLFLLAAWRSCACWNGRRGGGRSASTQSSSPPWRRGSRRSRSWLRS